MSLQTWLDEFYPVLATAVKGRLARIEHSLRKWEGALPENLQRHGVCYIDQRIIHKETQTTFVFGSGSCALCVKYLARSKCGAKCPVKQVDGYECDVFESAYVRSRYDPQPMIDVLRKALAVEKAKNRG